jgi:hypothetical protein
MTTLCPYVGLQPYTEAEQRYFFGRERDQRVIISNLYASPLTVLYGSSGVGKSSVLLAGVVPELRQRPRTAVVVFRNWQSASYLNDLKTACIQAVEAAANRPLTIHPTLPLDDLLFQAANAFGGSILVLLDQFEEYFLYHAPTDPENTFEAEFARAVNREEIDAGFLLVLREDGLSKLDRFRSRIPNLLSNMVRLNHLDAVSAEAAIRKPLEVYKQEFPGSPSPSTIENDLVARILTEVRSGRISLSQSAGAGQAKGSEDTAAIETPFLQLILTKLWTEEAEAGSPILRLSTFERLGGAQTIARTHLDHVMEELDPTEQEVCSRFFDRLVTPSGAKIAQSETDLRDYAGNLADSVPTVLHRLSNARIVRTIGTLPDSLDVTRYEIFHDILAAAILDWRRRYAQRQEVVKQAEDRAMLERQVNNRTRQLRWVIGGLLLLTLGAGYLAYFAWQQREEAVLQKAAAQEAQQEAHAAKGLAEQRLNRIVSGIKYKQLALAREGTDTQNIPGLEQADSQNGIGFQAIAKDLHYRDRNDREIWEFSLRPLVPSTSDSGKRIAFVTYRMNHPTFSNSLLMTGPDREFTASYTGWGCLQEVLVVIEYVDPDQPIRFVKFNMCDHTKYQ